MKKNIFYLILSFLFISFDVTYAVDVKKNKESHKVKTEISHKAVDLLVQSIFEMKLDKVKKQLKKISINERDQQGITALMAAATVGDMQILNLILQRKPDLELKSSEGETALGMALHSEQPQAFKKLRAVGASFDSSCGAEYSSLFICAVVLNNIEAANEIAKAKPSMVSDINVKDGNTALHFAAESGTEKIVKTLLTLGVDKKIKNKEGLLALDLAKQMNRKNIVLLLQ